MSDKASALVVDDDPSTLRALVEVFREEGFDVETGSSLATAKSAIDDRPFDLVVCDLFLPDGRGTEILELRGEVPTIGEVVLVTGQASVDTAVQALRQGAHDYLVKPVDLVRLRTLLTRVRRTRALQSQVAALREEMREMGRFGEMVGRSDAMQRIYDMIERVAPTDSTVLIQGESGTGKELAARTIHQLSRRAEEPFLAVNCGAISPQLIESELFGHEKGSFTGADKQRLGLFERADGGTLFLDEVTEMPPELQVKLLRVLEGQPFQRIGGTKDIDVDVRLLAATNRDPHGAVEKGDLREDLLYRLKVFPVEMPALRERARDIEILARWFLEKLNRAQDTERRFADECLEALLRYDWPGNVRELRNVVERASILADDVVRSEHLPREITGARRPRKGEGIWVHVGTTIADVERDLLLMTLESCDGNKTRTAELLGVSPRTVYNQLKALEEEGVITGGDE